MERPRTELTVLAATARATKSRRVPNGLASWGHCRRDLRAGMSLAGGGYADASANWSARVRLVEESEAIYRGDSTSPLAIGIMMNRIVAR